MGINLFLIGQPALRVIIVPSTLLIWAGLSRYHLVAGGAREGAIAVGFALVGEKTASALALSILFGILGVGAAIFGALVWVTYSLSGATRVKPAQLVQNYMRQEIN